MADVIYPNSDLFSSNHAFSAIWKLTRAIKKSGWKYLSSGDGTSKDTSGVATSDLWGGAVDPSSDTYPTGLSSVNAWWNASGPVTLKIPISVAPTGTMIRGEKVTQATSAAEGELVGFDYDGSSAGHAVILPRVGTFDSTHLITGAVSGGTFTPSSALGTYIPEVVFFKSTDAINGSIYMQRVSNETENSSRFSVLAGSAGCTETVAPGGSGTGNSFPAPGSYIACGSQNGSPSHSNWFNINNNMGKAQIVAVNTTTSTGVSADGTFWILLGDVSSPTQSQFIGYLRCDNSEDADLDPFVFYKQSGSSLNGSNPATSATTGGNFTSVNFLSYNGVGGSMQFRGWRRRGFASADTFNSYNAVILVGSSEQAVLADNNSLPETIACAYTSKRLREPIVLVSQDNTNTLKGRKGSPRWLSAIQGSTTFDSFDVHQKVCIAAPSGSVGFPAILAGPFDGITSALQA